MEVGFPYEIVKELWGKHGIQVDCEKEIDHLWDGWDPVIARECFEINDHFKRGGSASEIINKLIKTNARIRNLHTPVFIEQPKQEPVVLNIRNMDIADLVELKDDVETMLKKGRSNPGSGTAEGWNKFLDSSAADLLLFCNTGLLDDKYLRLSRDGQTVASVCAQHCGLTQECLKACDHFGTESKNVFQIQSSKTQSVTTGGFINQFQIDYIFLMVLSAKSTFMSLDELKLMITNLSSIFNKMPFTKRVLSKLVISSKYPVLKLVEEGLQLIDSPFRLNRSRLQAAISAVGPCVSDRMIGGDPPEILRDLLDAKRRSKISVDPKQGTTSVYESCVYNVLTTPNPVSKIRNRTLVEKNGLNTVEIILKDDLQFNNNNSSKTKASTKPPVSTPINPKNGSGKVSGPFHNMKTLLKSCGGVKGLEHYNFGWACLFLDIEGPADVPNEVGGVVFGCSNYRDVIVWKEVVWHCDVFEKEHLLGSQYCNGLTKEELTKSPNKVDKINTIPGITINSIPLVVFTGEDVGKYLKKIGYIGSKFEVKLPDWETRKREGFKYLDQPTICKLHNGKLKVDAKEIEKKKLPHCAIKDAWALADYVVGNKVLLETISAGQ